ncbi:sugar transferase [Yoonia vestfoldensis]|uniref:UDP-glucose:undecaprenyl-phosphate glucose-1-phosphate transferase n=1 Tax=Yoonia vestfoldensis TaxID=245188 RepID=A0A1Y0EBG0_9RHOB|nr:sugar transferase [Yoonia vestfoldensis]ARU00903.1 UDP-glucose:undecaprenyl-phosphate glucose-1-phosphate transferase [Yoonia vestfoldensis]
MDGGPKRQDVIELAEPCAIVTIRDTFYTRYGKRVMDVALALVLLPILLPVMALIALGMAHRGQVIFMQDRVGKDGKVFRMYKFRSMRVDAEVYLEELCASDPAIALEWELNQRLDPDPRVTKLGHILRRTKLDELPQIVNILRGDMSFVGPRPFIPSQKDMYDACPRSAVYYHLRPGVTGPWQLDRERDKRFVARANYDADYAAECAAAVDRTLLLRTALVPFKMTGR